MPQEAAIVLIPCLRVAGGAVLMAAGLHDIATRTIPDALPLALGALGAVLRLMDGTLPSGLLAATLVFAAAWICWRCAWLGGGDVKLLAAATLFAPPGRALMLLLAVALAGGVLAMLYLALRLLPDAPPGRRPVSLLARILRAERFRIRRRAPLPYATAIAAGGLVAMFAR